MKAKVYTAILMVATSSFFMRGEESPKVSPVVGIDLVSQYIWRGQDLGDVSIQPTLGIEWRGLSFGAWGSSGFDKDDVKELDFTLAYSRWGFTAGITDYWFDNGPGYFKYGAHDTAHVFEAHLGYDFKFATLDWYTNFAGNDGVTRHGHRAYSSYAEVGVPFSILTVDWKAELGFTPWGTTSYNASRFAVIDIAVGGRKDFIIADKVDLGVGAKLIFNPRDDKAYFVASISASLM